MNKIQGRPVMHWMTPNEIIHTSLDDLHNKNKVICIPGAGNKALYAMTKMLPERLWYVLATGIVNKMP